MSKFSELDINLIKKNDLVTGEIVGQTNLDGKEFFLLNINGKSEALLKKIEGLKVGDFVDVIVENACDKNSKTIVNYEKAQTIKLYDSIKEELKTSPNKNYKAKIEKKTKSGYLVSLQPGILALLEYKKTGGVNKEINEIVDVCIESIGKNNEIKVFLPGLVPNHINVGDTLKCVVKNVNDNCYYLSFEKKNKDARLSFFDVPEGITYKVGDSIEVIVKKKTPGRLHVSSKQIVENNISKNFKEKDFYPVTVTAIHKDVIEVTLENNIKATLKKDFSKALLNGQEEGLLGKSFEVQILKIYGSKIFLSMHATRDIKVEKGEILKGIIIDKNLDMGFAIIRSKNMEVILYKNNCHRDYNESQKIFNELPMWSYIDVEVSNVDLNKFKIYVTLPNILKDRKDTLSLTGTYDCVVKKIFPNGVLVEFKDSQLQQNFINNGFISKNEINCDFFKIKIGDTLSAQIIKLDTNNDLVSLSCKSLHSANVTKALSNFSQNDKPTFFDLFKLSEEK